jgi:hypothetical protein
METARPIYLSTYGAVHLLPPKPRKMKPTESRRYVSTMVTMKLSVMMMYEITIRSAQNARARDVPGFVKKADVLAASIKAAAI